MATPAGEMEDRVKVLEKIVVHTEKEVITVKNKLVSLENEMTEGFNSLKQDIDVGFDSLQDNMDKGLGSLSRDMSKNTVDGLDSLDQSMKTEMHKNTVKLLMWGGGIAISAMAVILGFVGFIVDSGASS